MIWPSDTNKSKNLSHLITSNVYVFVKNLSFFIGSTRFSLFEGFKYL